MSDWYDRKGNPLPSRTKEDWQRIEELLGDLSYKRIAETTLPTGVWVSTVWLGLDHNFTKTGSPLIFETMVFPTESDSNDLDCKRYATAEEAYRGHLEMVKKWKEKEQPQ